MVDQEGGKKTLQYDYVKTGKIWLVAQTVTLVVFIVTQIVLVIVYPALAACVAILVGLQFSQLIASLRWVAIKETLVLDK
jgi:hypothetical protein